MSKVKHGGIGGGCRAAHDAASPKDGDIYIIDPGEPMAGFECVCSGTITLTEAEALGMLDNPPEPNAELLALLQLDSKGSEQ
jgi:hypothetical protein